MAGLDPYSVGPVDRTLDEALIAADLSPATAASVAPPVEGLLANRLGRYATRAAARARMTGDERLVIGTMRAHALAVVTLASFGWEELPTPHGVWIIPDR